MRSYCCISWLSLDSLSLGRATTHVCRLQGFAYLPICRILRIRILCGQGILCQSPICRQCGFVGGTDEDLKTYSMYLTLESDMIQMPNNVSIIPSVKPTEQAWIEKAQSPNEDCFIRSTEYTMHTPPCISITKTQACNLGCGPITMLTDKSVKSVLGRAVTVSSYGGTYFSYISLTYGLNCSTCSDMIPGIGDYTRTSYHAHYYAKVVQEDSKGDCITYFCTNLKKRDRSPTARIAATRLVSSFVDKL